MKDLHFRAISIVLFLLFVSGRPVVDASGAVSLQEGRKTPKIYSENYHGNPVYYYGTIDTDPSFKGGKVTKFTEWIKFRRDNKGPRPIGISVTYSFIVDSQGKVQDIKIETENEKEAQKLRKILRRIPDWSPGIHEGRPVNTFVRRRIVYVGD